MCSLNDEATSTGAHTSTYLRCKSYESKSTATLGQSIYHNNRIDHLSELLEEFKELHISHCIANR